MSEAAPTTSVAPEPLLPPSAASPSLPPSPELWLAYLARRREALIMELRALDRALGRPQTIPERVR